MIFSLDTNLNYLPFIDICSLDSSGIYYFPMVPLGTYLIYAIPFLPVGYLPTYFGDVIFWEDATLVTLGQPTNPYDIHLVTAYALVPGIGQINGQINSGDLPYTLVDKITMLLMNEEGQTISFNQVTEEGEFNFAGLDHGIYYLYAEMAGCSSEYIKIEISAENPVIDVVLTFSGNKILGIGDEAISLQAGLIYPNPATDQALITLKLIKASRIATELLNINGQAVWRNDDILPNGTSVIRIPVIGVPSGIYTLRIQAENGLNLTRKLIKSR
jgi:hypothetical protein